ncbi:MAG: flagellin, partial [Synergistaceae bacterium]|nr:flagellin [Synergistaceae bacterium]
LGETNSMLQRMRELAVQAANDTLTSQDRSYIQMEIDELKASIDRIANTTEFNGRSILDGSVCGTVTSTDPAVKGYIRGALETEGNFRIEVKADPGEAQVQKSSIMRVKHENVATNKNVNTDSGVGGVKIDGLPAGNYSVTATKIGGGQTITEYTSTTKINVEKANTSGVPEILRLSITGETTDGKSIYWPQNSSYSKTYKELTVPKDAKKADIIALVKTELDGKTISLADSSGGNATAFELEVDDDGKVTAKSTEGKLTELQFIPQSKSNINPGAGANSTSNLSTSNSKTDTKYVAELAGRITLKDNHTETASASSITFTVTDGGTTLGSTTVSIPAGTSVSGITAILNGINETYLKANGSTGDKYSLTSSESSNNTIKVTATVSEGSDVVLGQTDSGTPSSRNRYTLDHTGTTAFVSESPRDKGEEKYTLRIHGLTSGVKDLGEITFDSNVKTAEDIAQKVVELVEANSSVELNGVKVFLDVQQNGSSYTITTSNANQDIRFSFYDYKGPDATTKVPNASFKVSDDGGKAVPGSVASLTGFYGDQSTAQTLSS